MRPCLGADGTFLFGKHRGELAEKVARSNPGYLRWLLGEMDDLDDGDRAILEALAARFGK